MKFLFFLPNLNGGGAEIASLLMLNELANRGHDCKLFLFQNKGQYFHIIDKRICLHILNIKSAFISFYKIRNIISYYPEHLIVSYLRGSSVILGMLSYTFKNRNFIFFEQNTLDGVTKFNFLYYCFYRFCYIISHHNASTLISNSNGTRISQSKFSFVDKKTIALLPNPFYKHPIRSNETYSLDWFEDDEIRVILNVGRLSYQKNHSLLLKIFKNLLATNNRYRLLIIGDGELGTCLNQEIKDHKLCDYVLILPFQKSISYYYQNSNIFLLTSRWEGFGNVLIESILHKLPVFSTNCIGGPRSLLIDGVTGFKFYTEEIENIVKIILDNEKFCISDQTYLMYRETFSIKNICDKFLEIIGKYDQ